MKALMTAKGREKAREMLTAYLGYPPPLPLSEQTTAELRIIAAAVQAGLRTPEWRDEMLEFVALDSQGVRRSV